MMSHQSSITSPSICVTYCFNAQTLLQDLLKLFLRVPRIAGRMQKAFLGSQACSLTVCVDCASFQHDWALVSGASYYLNAFLSDQLVLNETKEMLRFRSLAKTTTNQL